LQQERYTDEYPSIEEVRKSPGELFSALHFWDFVKLSVKENIHSLGNNWEDTLHKSPLKEW